MASDLRPDADLVTMAKKASALIDEVTTLSQSRSWPMAAPALALAGMAVKQAAAAVEASAQATPTRHVSLERRGDWLPTFSGVRFYPLDPKAEEVRSEDIARALAVLPRHRGITDREYSQGEYSARVAALAKHLMQAEVHALSLSDMETAQRASGLVRLSEFYGGLCVAHLAYLPDIAGTIAADIEGWSDKVSAVQAAVHVAFGLPAAPPAEVGGVVERAQGLVLLLESRDPLLFSEATRAELLYRRDIPDWVTTGAIEEAATSPGEFWRGAEGGRAVLVPLLASWYEQGKHAAAVAEDPAAKAPSGKRAYMTELAADAKKTISSNDFEPPPHLRALLGDGP